MPSVSRNQKVAAIIAEKVKTGKQKATPGQPSTSMAKSMSTKQLGDFTGGPMKGLPKKVKKPKGGY